MNEELRKIVKKYEDEKGFVNLIREGSDSFNTSLNLEDEIIFFFIGLNIEHKVELVEAYQDYSRTYYVLCVSYVVDGQLETYNVPVSA